MKTKRKGEHNVSLENPEYRLKFHFEGQLIEGVRIQGRIIKPDAGYQSTLIKGFNSRNIYIKPMNQTALMAILSRIELLKQKSLTNSLHAPELEQTLAQLKKKFDELDAQIEELHSVARFSDQHQAVIHETMEELERPIRLASVSGQFLDDQEIDKFSTLLYEDVLNLNLVGTQITSKGAISLFEKLAGNSTLKGLNLESNAIDNAAMLVFAKNIETNSTLRGVSFAKNPDITSACVPALVQAFTRNKTLYKVNFEGTGLSDNEIRTLTQLVAKNTPKEPSTTLSGRQYLSNWFGKNNAQMTERTRLVDAAEIPLSRIN